MKTPWSNLVTYGVGGAAILVIAIGGIIMLSVVAVAVLISKFLVFIK
jgi:hypothetical protein